MVDSLSSPGKLKYYLKHQADGFSIAVPEKYLLKLMFVLGNFPLIPTQCTLE